MMTKHEKDLQKRIEEHYNQDLKTFVHREKIEYQNINRWVKSFIAAGETKENNYVYVANKLVDDVFLGKGKNAFGEDNKEVKQRFSIFCKNIYEDRYSRTIFLIGIEIWVQLFKAFFIAMEDWTKEEANQNYISLIDLFFLEKETKNFDLLVIRNLNSCIDGISGTKMNEAFLYLLEKMNTLKIVGNMNNSEYFLVFLKRSLLALYFLGYDNRIDIMEINLRFMKGNEPSVEELKKFLSRIRIRIHGYKAEFERSEKSNVFEKEIKDYGIIEQYLLKLETVIADPSIVKKIDERGKVTTHFPSAEKMKEYTQMEDEAFYREIKDEKLLTACQKYEILKSRNLKIKNN